MDNQHQILVVTPISTRGRDIRTWLSAAGYWVTLASSFPAAKQYLLASPTVLITDLKLGEYNGLHLAVRAATSHTAVLIVSEPNHAVEREAEKLGASYLSTAELTRERILAFVESRLPLNRLAEDGDARVEWTDRPEGTPTGVRSYTTSTDGRRFN